MALLDEASTTHPWVEEQVYVLVKKNLILLIPCTKVLQELVSLFHDLLHSDIFALMQRTYNGTRDSSHWFKRRCVRYVFSLCPIYIFLIILQ